MGFKIGRIIIIGRGKSKEEKLLEYVKKWESMSAKELLDRSMELTDKLHKIADEIQLPPWIIAGAMQAASQEILLSTYNQEIIEAFRTYKRYVDENFMKKEITEP